MPTAQKLRTISGGHSGLGYDCLARDSELNASPQLCKEHYIILTQTISGNKLWRGHIVRADGLKTTLKLTRELKRLEILDGGIIWFPCLEYLGSRWIDHIHKKEPIEYLLQWREKSSCYALSCVCFTVSSLRPQNVQCEQGTREDNVWHSDCGNPKKDVGPGSHGTIFVSPLSKRNAVAFVCHVSDR